VVRPRLILTLLLPFLLSASGFKIPSNEPITVDISQFTAFYSGLAPDEQEEQLRDWAFYGLLSYLGFNKGAVEELTGGFPMRYDSLKRQRRFAVLPGRVACPERNECVMLVPAERSGDELLPGSLFDKERAALGRVPASVHVFTYAADIPAGGIRVAYLRTIKGAELLSPAFGYIRKEITGPDDLKQFLSDTGDITLVRLGGKNVILGGRRNRFGATGSLSYEDIAALQQAYMTRVPPEKEKARRDSYEKYIAEQYSRAVKGDAGLRKAIKTGKIKYSEIIAEIKRNIPYASLEDTEGGAGFSLDALLDYNGIADGVRDVAQSSGAYTSELLKISERVRSEQDLTPVLKLRRRLADSKDINDKRLNEQLQNIELNNTYQTARYDGKMKGTGPAMVLFYTDLTAKLWALDYNGMAPRGAVTGFTTLSAIKVPKLYWDDFVRLSKTRLWFGLKQEGFDIDGNEVLFDPVATRVYAASSDPLYPGKESEPNYQSGEFLGWWDRHYAAVADFEPYFHKLNELQKWSCIMMILKEKRSGALDFLSGEKVERSLDFEAWYKNAADVKIKTALPFIDRNRFKKTTECFKILQSEGYPLMGRVYFVSGGVSLASRKDISAKLHKGTGGSAREARAARPGMAVPAAKSMVKAPVKQGFGSFSAVTEGRTVNLRWSKGEGAVLDELVNNLAAPQSPKDESVFKGMGEAESVTRLERWKSYLIKSRTLKDKWIYLSINPAGKLSGYAAKAAGTEPDSDIFCAKIISAAQAGELSSGKGVPVNP
jgi:hypothetical protein